MSSHYLQIDGVYEWNSGTPQPRLKRVLWIEDSTDSAVLIDIQDPKAKIKYVPCQILRGELEVGSTKRVPDPYAYLSLPTTSFSESQVNVRNSRKASLAVLIANPEILFHRKQRIEKIQEITNRRHDDPLWISPKHVYFLLRQFWQRGQIPNAFIPEYDKCGWSKAKRKETPPKNKLGANRIGETEEQKRGGFIVTPKDEDNLELIGKLYRTRNPVSKKKRSWREALEEGCRRFYKRGWKTLKDGTRVEDMPPKSELPTVKQLKRVCRERADADRTLFARVGERKYNLQHRPLNGDQRSIASGPMQLVQMDAQTAKIYLVHRVTRRLTGRPTIVFGRCTYSRLCAGFVVTYEFENWTAYRLAIIHMATNKVSYCASLNIPISEGDWPCHDLLPSRILADNGPMISKFSDEFQEAFGVQIWDAASGRPDMKPVIESGFNDFNNRLVFRLPGAVLTESTDPDADPVTKKYKEDASLDINEFEQLTALYCLDYNKRVLEDYPLSDDMIGQVDPIPLELWNWGIRHRTGGSRPVDLNALQVHCLPHGSARVTERGICFEGKYYECKRSLSENWQSLARNVGEWWVEIVYEPNNLRQVYLLPGVKSQRNPAIEPCWRKPTEGESHEISLAELRGAYVQHKIRLRSLNESEPQRSAEFAAKTGTVVESARKKTKEALAGRKQSKNGLSEARAQARSEEREVRLPFELTQEEVPEALQQNPSPNEEFLPAASGEDFDEILSTLHR